MDGQTEALTFGCQGVDSGGVVLDNIEFSPMSVPEPVEWAMIGLGANLYGLHGGRKTIHLRPALRDYDRQGFRRGRRWKRSENKSAHSLMPRP